MMMTINDLRLLINEAVKNAYDIVGVDDDATFDDIKKAYRKKALTLHPDRNHDSDLDAKMVMLNVAYGILSDPTSRKRYDLTGDRTLGDAGTKPKRQQKTSKQHVISKPQHGKSKSVQRYINDKLKMYCEIERTNNIVTIYRGRIGQQPIVQRHEFFAGIDAWNFMRLTIKEIMENGYR